MIGQQNHRLPIINFQLGRKTAVLGAASLIFIIFLTTLQLHINGSDNPYATDVGEIQNALPRWGTLHFTGYPQYTAMGSLFVTLLRPLLSPAISSSLYSAVWGAGSIGLLAWLMLLFDVPAATAAITALLFGLSTSMWIDASIAEVHTMTIALTLAALIAAVRFGRNGKKGDLYWLAFLSGQGVAHQRAFAFVGLGLLILVIHQWRTIGRALPMVIGLGLLGPLTYIYLPLRAWMGADWVFSSPGEWTGLRALLLDTKADRIIEIPGTMAEIWVRLNDVVNLLNADWPWPLWLLGLFGLLLPGQTRHERLGLTLSWLPYLLVSLLIWEGRVSDALLAVKMPVILLSAIGLSFISRTLYRRRPLWGKLSIMIWLGAGIWLFFSNRPQVLAITRDQSAFAIIETAQRIPPARDGRSQTLMALWGHDYWALTYAQAYEGQFPDLELVDHDTNFAAIIEKGTHLLTLSKTFYQRPLVWWQEQLGPVSLSSVTPGIVEIKPSLPVTAVSEGTGDHTFFNLGNGIIIRHAELTWLSDDQLLLTINWQPQQSQLPDYSVAVHLVAQEPPTDPQDLIAQADRTHPVDGWYPTSSWQKGETIRDHYQLAVSSEIVPATVRVSMYQTIDGQFQNSAWLSLPVPERP